jgi:hypothetical protein
MRKRAPLVRLWLLIGLFAAAILGISARPLARAWRCYELHATGTRAQAELVEKLAEPQLLLRLASGPAAGNACTAETSYAHWQALAPGAQLSVVHRAEVPGECTLEATLHNSAALLWLVTGTVAAILLGALALGAALQRSFRAPGQPRRRMPVDPSAVLCPACGDKLGEGYVPLLAGLHWRELGEPVGLPHALAGLPGTVGWRGRPRLHAFRCPGCEILILQYGR